MEITAYHYLFIGLFMFLAGICGTIITKNIIKVLISIEFMLLGININFVTFGTFTANYDGYIFALFYTGIGAVELAVALYIFYIMFQKKKSDNFEDYSDL